MALNFNEYKSITADPGESIWNSSLNSTTE